MSASQTDPSSKFDHANYQFDWVSETGNGIWDFSFGQIPDDCINFVMEQWHRFGFQTKAEIHDVAIAGASAAFYTCDCINPNALFNPGISDVTETDEWGQFSYELLDEDGGPHSKLADVETTQTFRLMPGQAEAFFAEALGKPGLDALPDYIGAEISDCLLGHWNGEGMCDSIDDQAEEYLRALCTSGATFNQRAFEAYFEIAAWAGFIWLAGPLGRDYRYENIMLMRSVMDEGECLLISGMIWSPQFYRKHARLPRSCYLCGVQTWCVELTVDESATTLICEKCSFGDFPKRPHVTCGTRICRDSGCKHHPFAGLGREGGVAARREWGQLAAMAKGGQRMQRIGQPDQLKLGF